MIVGENAGKLIADFTNVVDPKAERKGLNHETSTKAKGKTWVSDGGYPKGSWFQRAATSMKKAQIIALAKHTEF